jgi:hypothetical protein
MAKAVTVLVIDDEPQRGVFYSLIDLQAAIHRMARHRDRRRKGLRCITIELHETEIDVLIRVGGSLVSGRLAGDSRGDLAAVRTVLYGFLDDYLR